MLEYFYLKELTLGISMVVRTQSSQWRGFLVRELDLACTKNLHAVTKIWYSQINNFVKKELTFKDEIFIILNDKIHEKSPVL